MKREVGSMLFIGCNWSAVHRTLFTFPSGVIGRICSLIVDLPGHLLYCFECQACRVGLNCIFRSYLTYVYTVCSWWLSRICVRLVIRRSWVWSPPGLAAFFHGDCTCGIRLIIRYFLWSFSPFCWFKKGSCQFLAKRWAQVLVNCLED